MPRNPAFATQLEQRSPCGFLCAAISKNAMDRYDYPKGAIDVIFCFFISFVLNLLCFFVFYFILFYSFVFVFFFYVGYKSRVRMK